MLLIWHVCVGGTGLVNAVPLCPVLLGLSVQPADPPALCRCICPNGVPSESSVGMRQAGISLKPTQGGGDSSVERTFAVEAKGP